MAKQTINIGTAPNTGTGEPLRSAFNKINENFTEVYSIAQSSFDYANTIVSDTQVDPFSREQSNSAFDVANSSTILAQSAFDYANTIVSNTAVDSFARDTANAAFEQANTVINPFNQDLNTSNNVIFNDITFAGNLVSGNSEIVSVANSSGDGEGATTLELVPDVSLRSTDRFVIIDPTTPNHIHIRAGGTQDNSQASLFFGGENSYFAVDSGENPAVVISSNNKIWTFNTDGEVFFPDFSVQTTAFTANPTLDSTVTNILKVESGIQVNYANIANATGTVTHNCANGQIFNHITPESNWTADFTNLQLQNGYSTTLTLVINQGATGYIANTILIDNSATTIKWEGNVVPTPSTNSIDVLTFNLLKTGFNNSQVIILGKLTNFG
jgi:hypothetical protein